MHTMDAGVARPIDQARAWLHIDEHVVGRTRHNARIPVPRIVPETTDATRPLDRSLANIERADDTRRGDRITGSVSDSVADGELIATRRERRERQLNRARLAIDAHID